MVEAPKVKSKRALAAEAKQKTQQDFRDNNYGFPFMDGSDPVGGIVQPPNNIKQSPDISTN